MINLPTNGPVLEEVRILSETWREAKKGRESILAGMKELGIETGLILTRDEKREEKMGVRSIKILPVREWLLGSELQRVRATDRERS